MLFTERALREHGALFVLSVCFGFMIILGLNYALVHTASTIVVSITAFVVTTASAFPRFTLNNYLCPLQKKQHGNSKNV